MIKKVSILFMMIFLISCHQLVSVQDARSDSAHLVDFKFDKRDLKDVLNEFAQLRGINILYSSTTQLNAKVTFNAGKKITFAKAWDFLLMMLELGGFSLVNQGQDLYALVTSDQLNTMPLPIYINTDPDELPLTQERIRYIYYFKNINVAQQQNDLLGILKNFADSKNASQQLIIDSNYNALILTAKSEMIKAIMKFVDVFDQSIEPQSIEIFPLKYASSVEVASILTDQLINGQGVAKSSKGLNAKQQNAADDSSLFSSKTRVISLFGASALGTSSAVTNSNSIVIFGKKKDIEQVKNFIKEHLDVPLEQGKSFFHVVDLQWINSATLTDVLNNLIKPSSGSGQSSSVSLSDLAFDPQIQVVPETITQGLGQSQGDAASLATGAVNNLQRGSNKVIIAATNKDWGRIQDVINKIDIPQKQVIIEVLILDLAMVFTHKIASQVRTNSLTAAIFPKTVQAQASMLINTIVTQPPLPANTSLQADLSNILGFIAGSGGDDQTVDSTVLMIGDKTKTNGIWAFFQLLALHQTTKTVSRAFVIAQNNQPAVITSSITKRLKGKLTAGVTATISYQTVAAPVTVNITPLISSNNIINLQMEMDATYWNDPTNGDSGTAQNRQLQTNFSMQEGQVAVLGGLTYDQVDIIYNGVPFLDKIPLLNLLFTNRSKTEDKTKLFLLVKPTIIKPTVNGMGKVTRRIAAVTDHLLKDDHDDLFSSLSDPISHWVFDESVQPRKIGLPLHDLFMHTGDATGISG